MRLYEILSEQNEPGMFVGVKIAPQTVSSLTDWMVANNIPNPYSRDELHVTLIFSKTKEFPWQPEDYKIIINPSTYRLEKFGTEHDMLVLSFKSNTLSKRHYWARKEYNIPWDFDEYTPHITLAKDLPRDFNTNSLQVPDFPIVLLGEYIERYQTSEDVTETAGVGTIQKHNTTVDVKPGEIQRQAKKWGWKVDKNGVPPTFWEKSK